MPNARLTALRLVGFKSFAEKTVVEFGPGISAVVGPNGSGKSNLADALRWTLGEQGRMLRTRRSEDVIFAGSSSRRAIGMADVTLVIDNGDRLLPVDYGEIEIGRRLYRSGESEYLLNRQRIRLRDLTELLDAGNLADNAFLFIGQGMVDQALALRPEERRPLFEEAAGVRRHERRRRQAEAELVEAEANLDRLRDVLAELRPQAKRLAAQAEQLQARRTAGVELAEGLLVTARAKWIAAAQTAAAQQKSVDRARAAADAALAALKAAEDESAALSVAIGKRAETEKVQRDELDRQRALLSERRVALARIESETASLERDRDRVAAELGALETRAAEALRTLAEQVAIVDSAVVAELDIVERQIAELEPAAHASDAAAQLRARSAELEQQMRRRDSIGEAEAGARARSEDLTLKRAAAEQERAAAVATAEAARAALGAAQAAAAAAQQEVDGAAAARSAAHNQMSGTEAELAAARATQAALDAALNPSDDGLARAARARGGTLVGEGLEVDPKLRRAVASALGALATGYLVDEASVEPLAGGRGTLAVRGSRSRSAGDKGGASMLDAATKAGGGALVAAILRDPQGDVTRLLGRVVWVPALKAALELRAQLAPGWRVVTVAGEVVDDHGVITLESGESVLDRRAEKDVAERNVRELDDRLGMDRAGYENRRQEAAAALDAAHAASGALDAARQEVRRTEELERVAQRRAEQLVREHSWENSQQDRLQRDIAAADALVTRLLGEVDRLRAEAEGIAKADGAQDRSVLRLQLVGRRDELRRQHDDQAAAARTTEEARRRAELTLSIDDSRRTLVEAESLRVADRLEQLARGRAELTTSTLDAETQAGAKSAQLDNLLAAGADERTRLVAAERAAIEARDKLREAETTSRQADMTAMEARLQLDQTREQLLVELATIGADGLTVLRAAAGRDVDEESPSEDDESAAGTLEDLLEQVVDTWRSNVGSDVAPTQGKLAALRRRFNELGAGNPYAVEEYVELRERLDGLETQRADMETAIVNTRQLIGSLSALINEQFRTTFAALEDAFERRFHELFGGGDAELSLTLPEDISATGIEIHARPPGKKRQPLSMLSGGERALTAVSLLLAMLEVRPVPFCVLDEVDAALDEANVSRFARALRGLADQTQFIVITHNRGTIEGADALYGVTIGDDAVSRVVSLRLPGSAANGHGPDLDDELAEAALA